MTDPIHRAIDAGFDTVEKLLSVVDGLPARRPIRAAKVAADAITDVKVGNRPRIHAGTPTRPRVIESIDAETGDTVWVVVNAAGERTEHRSGDAAQHALEEAIRG